MTTFLKTHYSVADVVEYFKKIEPSFTENDLRKLCLDGKLKAGFMIPQGQDYINVNPRNDFHITELKLEDKKFVQLVVRGLFNTLKQDLIGNTDNTDSVEEIGQQIKYLIKHYKEFLLYSGRKIERFDALVFKNHARRIYTTDSYDLRPTRSHFPTINNSYAEFVGNWPAWGREPFVFKGELYFAVKKAIDSVQDAKNPYKSLSDIFGGYIVDKDFGVKLAINDKLLFRREQLMRFEQVELGIDHGLTAQQISEILPDSNETLDKQCDGSNLDGYNEENKLRHSDYEETVRVYREVMKNNKHSNPTKEYIYGSVGEQLTNKKTKKIGITYKQAEYRLKKIAKETSLIDSSELI